MRSLVLFIVSFAFLAVPAQGQIRARTCSELLEESSRLERQLDRELFEAFRDPKKEFPRELSARVSELRKEIYARCKEETKALLEKLSELERRTKEFLDRLGVEAQPPFEPLSVPAYIGIEHVDLRFRFFYLTSVRNIVLRWAEQDLAKSICDPEGKKSGMEYRLPANRVTEEKKVGNTLWIRIWADKVDVDDRIESICLK